MSLPVLAVSSKPTTVVVKTVSDNQVALTTGKYAWQFTASSPVVVNLYGPFLDGPVDPTKEKGLGIMHLVGTKVDVGHTISKNGNYLVEILCAGTATVELTIRQWDKGYFLNLPLDTIWFQILWKLFG